MFNVADLLYEIKTKELCVYIKNPSDVRVYPPGKVDEKTGDLLKIEEDGVQGKAVIPQKLSGYCCLEVFRIDIDVVYIDKLLVIDENGEVAEERSGMWQCSLEDIFFKLIGGQIENNKLHETAEDLVSLLLKRGLSDKDIAKEVDSIFTGESRLTHLKFGSLLAKGRSNSSGACTARARRARGLMKT